MPRQAPTTGSLRNDPDDLLACFRCRTLAGPRQVGTTSAGERRFREVCRRTRPTGTFRDRTSTDRILHAVFIHENRSRGIRYPGRAEVPGTRHVAFDVAERAEQAASAGAVAPVAHGAGVEGVAPDVHRLGHPALDDPGPR